MNKSIKDFSASIVVFLVALPLCLGIAHASGVPVVSGLIAGVVGGIIVGFASGSNISVSGPAAGLITLILSSIDTLKAELGTDVGIISILGAAVLLAGVFQLLLGFLKLGKIADFIPVSVIKGMLAAIGILLILKQVPHLVGWDVDDFGDEDFRQLDGENTFTELNKAFQHITPLAMIIGVLGLLIQIFWELKLIKKQRWTQWIPAPLLVVLMGIGVNYFAGSDWKIVGKDHIVSIPEVTTMFSGAEGSGFPWPNFSLIGSVLFWIIVFKVAIIASLESLLSLEASDKIDPHKRISPANRELFAQGAGNIVSGLLGGLPVTAVIVRSSANANAGAQTKISAILHGFWLIIVVACFPGFLNLIPNAALSAILIFVGYKLAKPSLFKSEFQRGWGAFLPFVVTIISILLTDLLLGIAVGMIVGFYFVIKTNFHRSITVVSLENTHLIRFYYQATFLNKSLLKEKLTQLPDGAEVVLDFTNCHFVDTDIRDIIDDFEAVADERNLKILKKFTSDSHQHRLMNTQPN